MIPNENSLPDYTGFHVYTGYHVNYILQYGWNGYGIFDPAGTGYHTNFTKWFHLKKNGIVKMVKLENGQLN